MNERSSRSHAVFVVIVECSQTVADEEGTMVSLIQSNYEGFGSGLVIPSDGLVPQDAISEEEVDQILEEFRAKDSTQTLSAGSGLRPEEEVKENKEVTMQNDPSTRNQKMRTARMTSATAMMRRMCLISPATA